MRKQVLNEWGLKADPLFLAAGPCSAESEEQVLETAKALAEAGVSFLRAGIWKPRTRPGSFEGVGPEGLVWLERARAETGLKIGTEVAEPAHVEACLEHRLDVLWIGARTTTNPFSVQAIADALKGTDIPVFVKNPMSADVALWMGAVERLANAGLTRLGAIHRGVSSSLEMRYRNAPAWKMPIELMRCMPDLPMICDPSHICGKAGLIPAIAQEAMDLLFDGLMIEVHPNPPEALSDAAQQLTPKQFSELIDGLQLPHEKSESSSFIHRMSALRDGVDELDSQMLELLGRRMDVVREMGALKREQNISTLQLDRWTEILQDRVTRGELLNLSEPFVQQLMQSIHEEAIRQQEKDRIGL
ncbi:bifunctional 3-deoxy-7-phosphoheptulonate synthase/chorismate mutase type II [Pontiella agarivorans]|uniref:chorismate mutase n=1 Tax=Pontiella agarivorans TaxID=3038953 RepID=A0ABU5MSX1_9BACT|nr:bifunctional 3-deoxy-7-phosphoheptulonate synthase/chorismate mutase type II [Pontiella agarivorans]MDZ8117236.1 bifunctional 3-deoxy-7-phosphoheptulonate synthase/chorismate mutase type II [Pontiella agarivorans]